MYVCVCVCGTEGWVNRENEHCGYNGTTNMCVNLLAVYPCGIITPTVVHYLALVGTTKLL